MKQNYNTPVVSLILMSNEDVLTASGDVDYFANGKSLINSRLGNGERGIFDGLEI